MLFKQRATDVDIEAVGEVVNEVADALFQNLRFVAGCVKEKAVR